jgi:hypothetical protein
MTKDPETVDLANPKTQKVPEGGVAMATDAPEGPVGEDAPVWEGGDPGKGDPTPRDPESVETTYWPESAKAEPELPALKEMQDFEDKVDKDVDDKQEKATKEDHEKDDGKRDSKHKGKHSADPLDED